MARATCRCGQSLNVPDDGTDRIVCPQCGAKIRVRRPGAVQSQNTTDDGFVRFSCQCGRKLKVGGGNGEKPSHGKCPDCGRVVPVPSSSPPPEGESPTEEMAPGDVQRVAEWSKRHIEGNPNTPVAKAASSSEKSPWTSEAGLRICPGCGRPVHLGASVCRGCGSAVPKR